MTSNFRDLEIDIKIVLTNLLIKFKCYEFSKHLPKFFVIELLGVIVCGTDSQDVSEMRERLKIKYPGYKLMFVLTSENIKEYRYNIIWELMRHGYMEYVRLNYYSNFYKLIVVGGFGEKIINKRLEIWGNQPQFKWFIDKNKKAKTISLAAVLSSEPNFFDYMPD